MAETPNHGYNVPDEGDENWHVPLNENVEDFDADVEIRDTDDNRGNYEPKGGAKFLATDTEAVYVGDGSAWNRLQTSGRRPSFDALNVSNDFLGVGTTEPSATLDVAGNVSIEELGASVYQDVDQSIPEGDRTTVEFDTILADDRDEVSLPDDEFVCAYDGDYRVEASLAYRFNSDPVGGRYDLVLQVDGSTRIRDTVTFPEEGSSPSVVNYVHLSASKTLRDMSAGDTIDVITAHYTADGTPLNTSGARYDTYLTVDQVG